MAQVHRVTILQTEFFHNEERTTILDIAESSNISWLKRFVKRNAYAVGHVSKPYPDIIVSRIEYASYDESAIGRH